MPNDTTARLRAFQARQRLTTQQLAALLGVPLTTAQKWLSGARNPSGAAVRLLDVLVFLEAHQPTVLAALKSGLLA